MPQLWHEFSHFRFFTISLLQMVRWFGIFGLDHLHKVSSSGVSTRNRCAEKAMWAGQLPEELRPRPPFAAVFEDLTC